VCVLCLAGRSKLVLFRSKLILNVQHLDVCVCESINIIHRDAVGFAALSLMCSSSLMHVYPKA